MTGSAIFWLPTGNPMPPPMINLGESIHTTPLGFGCAGLFRMPSSAERFRVLHAAYDAGIRHFDTAPMYGLGLAERELGIFAGRRRGELTIATKFGITPTLAARGIAHVQGPLRRIFATKPGIRDQARSYAAAQSSILYSQEGYDPTGARRSLERSLRTLRTDYVDLFLLHDPRPGSVRSEEVCSYLEQVRAKGLIRSWGTAGESGSTAKVAQSFPSGIPVRQVRDDIFTCSLQGERPGPVFITFGVITGGLHRLADHLRDDATRLRWADVIGADCGNPEIGASFLLRAAFKQNSSGVVLFSTTRVSRVNRAAAALEATTTAPADPALNSFFHMVDTELRGIPGGKGATVDHSG